MAKWNADEVRDDLRSCAVEHLGDEGSGTLIVDEAGLREQPLDESEVTISDARIAVIASASVKSVRRKGEPRSLSAVLKDEGEFCCAQRAVFVGEADPAVHFSRRSHGAYSETHGA